MQYPQFQQSYAQPQQPQQGIAPRAHIMGSLQIKPEQYREIISNLKNMRN